MVLKLKPLMYKIQCDLLNYDIRCADNIYIKTVSFLSCMQHIFIEDALSPEYFARPGNVKKKKRKKSIS